MTGDLEGRIPEARDSGAGADRTAVAVMGVSLLAAVLLMAVGLLAAGAGAEAVTPDDLRPAHLLSGLFSAAPEALVSLGILVLLASPALRLVVLAAGFGRRREWVFLGLTALVLAELAVSAVLVSRR